MFLIFFIINLLASWRILIGKQSIAYGDLSPFPETVRQALTDYFFAWRNISIGLSRESGYMFTLIQGLFLTFFKTPMLAQKMYILLLPILYYLSFTYFAKKFLGLKNKFVIFLIATFYAFTPIVFDESSGGTLYATILWFGVMPFITAYTYKFVSEPFNIKKILFLGFMVGFMSSIYAQIPFLFALSLVIPFLIDMIYSKFKAIKYWINMIFVGILAFLFNPIYFISSFGLIRTQDGDTATNFTSHFQQFLYEIMYSYRYSTILKILRLASNRSDFGYNTDSLPNLLFYIVTFMVIVFVLYKFIRTRLKDKTIATLFASYIGFSSFVYAIHLGLTNQLFVKIPIFFMFRNPAKLNFFITFFFCTLLAYSMEEIIKLINIKYLKIIFVVFITALIAFYIRPVFSGLKGMHKNSLVHGYYYNIMATINKDRKDSEIRTIWIPSTHENTSVELVWLDRNKLEAQIGLEAFGGLDYQTSIIGALNLAIKKDDLDAYFNILKNSGVGYIIQLKDPDFYKEQNFSPENISDMFKELEKLEETGNYIIYKTPYKPLPHIFTSSTISTTNAASNDLFLAMSQLDYKNNNILFANNTHMNMDIWNYIYSSPTAGSSESPYNNMLFEYDWDWPQIKDQKSAQEVINEVYDLQSQYDVNVFMNRFSGDIASLAEYSKQSYMSPSDKKSLVDAYIKNLNYLNEIMYKIPKTNLDQKFKSFIRKPIYYVDASYKIFKDGGLDPEGTIFKEIQKFSAFTDTISTDSCGTYFTCFDLTFRRNTAIDTMIYDLRSPEDPKSTYKITINDKILTNINRPDLKPRWLDFGNISYSEGTNHISVQTQTPTLQYYVKLDQKEIDVSDLKNPKTYEVSFFYTPGFEPTNMLVTAYTPYLAPDKQNHIISPKFAPSLSDIFCQYKENGKCYRRFFLLYSPPSGANTMFITFDKPFSMDGSTPFSIKDLTIKEYISPILSMVKQPSKISSTPTITYKKINPVKYEISITNGSQPYFLVLNEAFDKGWKLYFYKNGVKTPISDSSHEVSNGYANTWYIQPVDINLSDYKLTAEFIPQKSFTLSVMLTICYTIIVISLFGVEIYKSRKSIYKKMMYKLKTKKLFNRKPFKS